MTSLRAAIDEAFPPRLPNVYHVCLNSRQRSALERRLVRAVRIIPNTIELDDRLSPAPPDLRADLGILSGELMVVQPTRVVPRKGIGG